MAKLVHELYTVLMIGVDVHSLAAKESTELGSSVFFRRHCKDQIDPYRKGTVRVFCRIVPEFLQRDFFQIRENLQTMKGSKQPDRFLLGEVRIGQRQIPALSKSPEYFSGFKPGTRIRFWKSNIRPRTS